MLKDAIEFMQQNPVLYLATVGEDGHARCRPFLYGFWQEDKLWFSTSNLKNVYRQMQQNPYVEFSVSSPDYTWLRLHGKAVFCDDPAIKERFMQNPIVKDTYGSAENPCMTVFYLQDPHGELADFSGKPPRRF